MIRAISSAFEFTHTLWPSRFGRYAGRSDTTASSASFGGQPRGNASWDQPPPRIHGSSGVRGDVGRDDPLVVLEGVRLVQVALEHVESAADRMHVRVLEPGHEHLAGEVDHLGAGAG